MNLHDLNLGKIGHGCNRIGDLVQGRHVAFVECRLLEQCLADANEGATLDLALDLQGIDGDARVD